MWWKALSVVLLIYSFVAGLLVPLKPGIVRVAPETAKTGQTIEVQFFGYNSFYSKSATETRVWLEYDEKFAVMGLNVRAVNDTVLAATFVLPKNLPENAPSSLLTAIVDSPTDGVSLLPNAVKITQDTALKTPALDMLWTLQPVENVHVKRDFTFPYRNVIYESIRNTYYHVPMWFALLALLAASVWHSLMFLRKPSLDSDRKAAAFAETGLLFGFMGLFTGMVWANYAWGAPWSNDIKQLMTAVALLIYVAYFILRASFDEPEKGARLAAVYNIFAFASLIPLLYVVPRLFASLHPGATGSPAFGSQDLDNTMRLVFYPAIIGWILLGVWVTQIRVRLKRAEDRLLDIEG